MALPSAFQERIQQIEETRIQRFSLLEAEKELQRKKSLVLSAKRSNIRSMEQRCLFLDHKNSALSFKILAYKSEIDRLEVQYNTSAQQFRDLKSEFDEVEKSDKDKDKFYEMNTSEMKEFNERVRKRVSEARHQVDELRKRAGQVKSSLQEALQNHECSNNPEIAAAERRKAELLWIKENMERSLASNYQLRTQLEKQLYKSLISQDEWRKETSRKMVLNS